MSFAEDTAVVVPALLAAGALLAWLIRIEWSRPPGGRRTARLLASALAVAGLAGLATGPAFRHAVPRGSALLLTPGGRPEEAARRAAGASSVLAIAGGEPAMAGAGVVADAAHLARTHPEVARVVVVGQGLRAWEWEGYAGAVETAGIPGTPPGPRDLFWPGEIRLGEELRVRGSIAGASGSGTFTLRLQGPGGTEDETEIAGGPFLLRARPREPGRFLYTLEASGEEGTVTEVLPVSVREARRLTVLWLEAAPTFESRHFKTWLAGRGDAFALRSGISLDRWRRELHNLEETDLSRLTPALLDRFDLAVLDAATLASLSAAERGALRAALAEGLGVLVLPEPGEETRPAEPLAALELRRVGDLSEWAPQASWPGVPQAAPLVVEAREIVPRAWALPLVRDAGGRILAAAAPSGRGRAAISTVHDTFRWILQGSPEIHAAYWSHLTGQLARPERGARILLPPGPVIVDHPLTVTLLAPDAPRVTMEREGGEAERIAARQDPLEAERWSATWRPRDPGWHRVAAGDAAGAWFYAQPADRFAAWQATRRSRETAVRAVLGGGVASAEADRVDAPQRIPRPWFFAAFLIGALTLWADERRGG